MTALLAIVLTSAGVVALCYAVGGALHDARCDWQRRRRDRIRRRRLGLAKELPS